MAISQKYEALAKNIIETLFEIREDFRHHDRWTPVQELIQPIDAYFNELDPDWKKFGMTPDIPEKDTEIKLRGYLGESDWIDRLYGRLKRSKNRMVAIGVDACDAVKDQASTMYNKIKTWVDKNPGKTAIAAFFGGPATLQYALSLIPMLQAAITSTAAIIVSKEAVQVIAETGIEEGSRAIKWAGSKFLSQWGWLIAIGGGGVLVYLFRKQIFTKGRAQ